VYAPPGTRLRDIIVHATATLGPNTTGGAAINTNVTKFFR
jgi:hypothetical protein